MHGVFRFFLKTYVLGVLSAPAWSGPLREHLRGQLPPPARALVVGRSTREEVLKVLGKPGREAPDAFLYKLSEFEYDTVLSFRGKILRTIEFRFPPKKLSLEDLRKAGFPLEDGREDPATEKRRKHEWGRERRITLKAEHLILLHLLDDERSLRSVVFE